MNFKVWRSVDAMILMHACTMSISQSVCTSLQRCGTVTVATNGKRRRPLPIPCFMYAPVVVNKDNNIHMHVHGTTNTVQTEDIVEASMLHSYLNQLAERIQHIMSRSAHTRFTYDLLDTCISKQCQLIVLREKQRQMKIGEIWQEAIGTYPEFTNLHTGHPTGLDILSHTRKMAIELKNRTKTDNSSSRKANLDKLAKFKQEHPDYRCIYANINASTLEKTIQGACTVIVHNGVELEHMVGLPFLQLIFGINTTTIIEFMKNKIDIHTSMHHARIVTQCP